LLDSWKNKTRSKSDNSSPAFSVAPCGYLSTSSQVVVVTVFFYDIRAFTWAFLVLFMLVYVSVHVGFTFPVPAHVPGCPGQNPESRKTVVAVAVVRRLLQHHTLS